MGNSNTAAQELQGHLDTQTNFANGILRPSGYELTAKLCGNSGFVAISFKDKEELTQVIKTSDEMSAEEAVRYLSGWNDALACLLPSKS